MTLENNTENQFDILIVDDTPDNLRLVSEILTKNNFAVRLASDAKIALRSIKAKLPGLILLDIAMPDMDGFDFCKILKEDDSTKDIPVIFLSVHSSPKEKLKAFKLGGIDFISKPIIVEEILVRVKAHVANRKLQLELEQKNTILHKEIEERKQSEKKLKQYNEFVDSFLEKEKNNKRVLLSILDDNNKTLESLKESEEQNRAITQTAADAIISINSDGIILSWNKAAEKIFGYSSSEMINMKLTEIIPVNHTEGHNAGLQRLQDGGKEKLMGETIEITALRKNGTEFPIELSLSSWESKNQKYFTGIIRDITTRKRAEQIQKILYNISKSVISSDNLEELVSVIRQELGTIIDTSNFYIALYDDKTDTFSLPYLADQKEDITSFAAGNSFTNYVRKTQKSLLATKEKVKEMNKMKEAEMVGTASEIWLGVPLKVEGKVTGVLAVQSYTDKNAYNESDKEILEFISDQVSTSIERKKAEDDLILALEKAQESDRLKSAFLTNMSHEIRTPMNGILGFTSLLKEPNLTGEEQQDYINVIEESGDRMLNTINDLMDISMIESGLMKTKISETKINVLTKKLFSFFEPEVEKKGMSLKLNNTLSDEKATIITDNEKVNSILTNLIKNAIKYSKKGSIEFGYVLKTDSETSELEFYVKDTGIGVPKDRQQAIFERFVQADIEDRDVYEGNGLGLSISKAYVEMLNGKIWVKSEVGIGSTFYFTIPYKAAKEDIPESKDAKAELGTVHQEKKLKILITEDEEVSYLHLSLVLKNIEKEILHAKNGMEAVEICRNNPDIDLILMDVKMPKMGGLEATKLIREFNKNVVIIAQTAYALAGDREKTLEAGCNDYISKPIDKEMLFEKIGRLLSS